MLLLSSCFKLGRGVVVRSKYRLGQGESLLLLGLSIHHTQLIQCCQTTFSMGLHPLETTYFELLPLVNLFIYC